MSTCKGCGKPIQWAISPTGSRIPIDVVPVIYFLEEHGEADRPQLRAVPMPPHLQLVHGISHFINCPKAGEFSGRNKKT